jgi:hypothetical protein
MERRSFQTFEKYELQLLKEVLARPVKCTPTEDSSVFEGHATIRPTRGTLPGTSVVPVRGFAKGWYVGFQGIAPPKLDALSSRPNARRCLKEMGLVGLVGPAI